MLSLVFLASAVAAVAPCSTERIVAAAHVRHINRAVWPDYPRGARPDAATIVRRRSAAFAALGVTPLTEGLDPLGSTDVDWPVTNCSVSFGDGAVDGLLSDGRVVFLDGDDSVSVGNWTAPLPSEPAGPTVKNAQLIASTSISVGDWLVGVWRFPDGHSLIAAYRPGDALPRVPIMKVAGPVLGISYLGAPDSFGSNLTILQRVGRNSYRRSVIGWSEKAVRSAAPVR